MEKGERKKPLHIWEKRNIVARGSWQRDQAYKGKKKVGSFLPFHAGANGNVKSHLGRGKVVIWLLFAWLHLTAVTVPYFSEPRNCRLEAWLCTNWTLFFWFRSGHLSPEIFSAVFNSLATLYRYLATLLATWAPFWTGFWFSIKTAKVSNIPLLSQLLFLLLGRPRVERYFVHISVWVVFHRPEALPLLLVVVYAKGGPALPIPFAEFDEQAPGMRIKTIKIH